MFTKAAAIAHLRAFGTLATEDRQDIVIDAKQAGTTMAREVNRLMMGNARAAGVRHVAPSSNQVVLP
ncbi:MAG: hypothetical protein WA191_05180 [Telluria sp.]